MWVEKLQQLQDCEHDLKLDHITRGIEKEHLRVNFSGKIASTKHPQALGKALFNPFVTTDFSESLPEMVTPPVRGLANLYQHLNTINHFVSKSLRDEYLWPVSMPPQLANANDINIAEYGTTNVAKMKQVYREGLSHRYGRIMQSIAGIHYNFSLPDNFFKALQQDKEGDFSEFRSSMYMKWRGTSTVMPGCYLIYLVHPLCVWKALLLIQCRTICSSLIMKPM